MDGIQLVGVNGVLDRSVNTWPDSVTASPGVMVIDFGESTTMDDGTVWSGMTTVDASGLTTTGGTISGTAVITVDDLRANDLPVGSSTTWTFDLEERGDGTVVGEITAEPEAGPSADGTVSGTIIIDTAICEKYPIAGSLTFISGGQITTLAPSPECDGSLVPDVFVMPPGYDFVSPRTIRGIRARTHSSRRWTTPKWAPRGIWAAATGGPSWVPRPSRRRRPV